MDHLKFTTANFTEEELALFEEFREYGGTLEEPTTDSPEFLVVPPAVGALPIVVPWDHESYFVNVVEYLVYKTVHDRICKAIRIYEEVAPKLGGSWAIPRGWNAYFSLMHEKAYVETDHAWQHEDCHKPWYNQPLVECYIGEDDDYKAYLNMGFYNDTIHIRHGFTSRENISIFEQMKSYIDETAESGHVVDILALRQKALKDLLRSVREEIPRGIAVQFGAYDHYIRLSIGEYVFRVLPASPDSFQIRGYYGRVQYEAKEDCRTHTFIKALGWLRERMAEEIKPTPLRTCK